MKGLYSQAGAVLCSRTLRQLHARCPLCQCFGYVVCTECGTVEGVTALCHLTGSAPPNLAATLQQCKMPLLVVVFLVLCGGITIGMFTVWKDEPGGLGRASIQSCPSE